MSVSFNSEEAVSAMKEAILNNEDLIASVNKVNQQVENSFVDGEAVGGAGGQIAANQYNDTVSLYYDAILKPAVESFIDEKIKPIIEKNNEYLDSSNKAFVKTSKCDLDYGSNTGSTSTITKDTDTEIFYGER